MPEWGLGKLESKEAKPSIREVEKVLEQIDFAELARIYKEIGIKCGVPEETMAPLTREVVQVKTPESLMPLINHFVSGWASSDGDIILQPDAMARRAGGHYGLKKRVPLAAATLNILCHEEAHGSAFRGEMDETGEVLVSGIAQDAYDEKRKEWRGKFRLLNEAVTDIIGKRAYESYLSRRRLVDTKDPQREIRASDWLDSYAYGHWIFDALTQRIAKEFEVPADVVENAFIRAAFEGEDLSSDDMRELFEQSVSPVFYKNIQNAAHFPVINGVSATIDLAQAIAELKGYEWSNAIRARWANVLNLKKSANR